MLPVVRESFAAEFQS